jgi:hypothetical protein
MVRSHDLRGTSSMSAAFVGWLVAAGFCALLVPVATLSATLLGAPLMAIPFIVMLAIAFLVGGYAAGSLAGHRTGYHGALTGVVALVVVGIVTLADSLGAAWLGSGMAVTAGALPWVTSYGVFPLAFAGIAVFLLAAWLGGLAAPSRVMTTATRAAIVPPARQVPTERVRRERVVQQAGAKGGERIEQDHKG